jgi:peptidoglycan/LPS O-acetylase OafA/YrhL
MVTRPFLKNLNGLRFLAASYTIFFHYWSFPNSDFLSRFAGNGHISVPFFFLLSGFVLSYSYHDYPFFHKSQNKKFILSRIIRLAPIYYIAMFLAVPLIIQQHLHTSYSLGENVLFTLAHLTMTQSFLPYQKLIEFWNVHSWSLSVEMFLYAIFPILFFKIRNLKINKLYQLIILLLFINSTIFVVSFSPFEIFKTISTFFSPLYIPIFLNGIILAKIYVLKRVVFEKNSPALFTFSIATLIILFFAGLDKTFYSAFNPIFQLAFSVLILSSCSVNRFNSFLGNKIFFTLGEASYAMYMLQAPVKTVTQQFLFRILGYKEFNGFIFCFTIYFSIIFCSLFLSRYIDPRIRKIMTKKLINTN